MQRLKMSGLKAAERTCNIFYMMTRGSSLSGWIRELFRRAYPCHITHIQHYRQNDVIEIKFQYDGKEIARALYVHCGDGKKGGGEGGFKRKHFSMCFDCVINEFTCWWHFPRICHLCLPFLFISVHSTCAIFSPIHWAQIGYGLCVFVMLVCI